jgi:hypothetical protein
MRPLRGRRRDTGEKIGAALQRAGIVFIDENGVGASVRLTKRGAPRIVKPDGLAKPTWMRSTGCALLCWTWSTSQAAIREQRQIIHRKLP